MTRYDAMMDRLRRGAQIVIDGGTGTEVERRGVPQLEHAWNGGGTLSHPDVVRGIHEDYIRHGAEIVISNTFATGRNVMEDAGAGDEFEAYNRRAVELACEAREITGRPDVLVAGGISHWSFTSRLPSLEDVRSGAAAQAQIMADAGADLIMLEMMVEIDRMLAVLEGAQASGLPVWVGLSCGPDETGAMCLQCMDTDEAGVVYGEAHKPLAAALAALDGKGVPLVSIMHTDTRHIDACLDIVEPQWSGLIGVYAHSGEFIDNKWMFEGTISPEAYAQAGRGWLDRRVSVLGGCCGIRPDHMAAVGTLERRAAAP